MTCVPQHHTPLIMATTVTQTITEPTPVLTLRGVDPDKLAEVCQSTWYGCPRY